MNCIAMGCFLSRAYRARLMRESYFKACARGRSRDALRFLFRTAFGFVRIRPDSSGFVRAGRTNPDVFSGRDARRTTCAILRRA
jgi:hypothetical protein